MILVVAESSGSSPGRQGFKMAIAQDQMIGSIGGGIMEVKLVELAKKMLKENVSDPIIKKQVHSKSASRHQSGMICSGEQTVIYFKLDQTHLPSVQRIIRMQGKYKSAVISISYKDNSPHFMVTEDMKSDNPFDFEKTGETEFIYRENTGFKNRLYIIGGGHCALALSKLMSSFDFYIHVIDDRPGLNTMEQNSFAHEKHLIESYELIDQVVSSGPDVFVVVMTLGYRSDLLVLFRLVEKSFAYLGLLGSETKVKTLKEELKKSGYPERFIKEMHAPVGLKINSHSPEEIAVSIAAEIIKIKNAGE